MIDIEHPWFAPQMCVLVGCTMGVAVWMHWWTGYCGEAGTAKE